jgi:Holliday junction DNA helicase RuvB
MDDMTVLRRAFERETDPRRQNSKLFSTSWEYYAVGASREDIKRLIDDGFVVISHKDSLGTRYRLSEKGRIFVQAMNLNHEYPRVPAGNILEAMNLVVGFDDVKVTLARAIESGRRINFLLEGPPACAKSIMLEGIRSAVPGAWMCFGSRTSAAGLSDVLFEIQPRVLLADELDKMHGDCFSILLGLMESGDVLETKSQKTRGIKLNTMVIGACNKSEKFPPEFLSRFALHVHFPTYTRDEFIEVCVGFLTRAEGCPAELAALVGQLVYDYGIGDVRKARGALQIMTELTPEAARQAIGMMLKYGDEKQKKRLAAPGQRLL